MTVVQEFLAALAADLAGRVIGGVLVEEALLDEPSCLMFWTEAGDRFAVEWRASGELAGQGALDFGEAP